MPNWSILKWGMTFLWSILTVETTHVLKKVKAVVT